MIVAIITTAQVLEHFPGIVGSGEDTLLAKLVDRLDALAAAFCGLPLPDSATARTLAAATYTKEYDGPDPVVPTAIRLYDDFGPNVASITNVWIDADQVYSTAASSSGYRLIKPRGLLVMLPTSLDSWVEAPFGNRVTLVAGYATTPPDLIAACAMGVRHLIQLRRSGNFDQLTQAGQSFTLRDAGVLLPGSVKEALGPYRAGSSRVG